MTPPADRTTPDGGIESWPTGRLLSTAARLVEQSWHDVLHRHDVTHAGLLALHALTDGPRSQRDIARSCRVTDQTMSRTVERLERSGYVTRDTDPGDERRIRVAVTASGRRLFQRLVDIERDDSSLTAGVSDPDRLRGLLVELIRNRTATAPDGDGS